MVAPLSPVSVERGGIMNQHSTTFPVDPQSGRKGVAYDWQSLFASAEAADLDAKLAALTPALAE